jgi:hypothetical protein
MHPLDNIEDWSETTVEFMVATGTIRIITEWWSEGDGEVLKRSATRGRPRATDPWRFPCGEWQRVRVVPNAKQVSGKRFIANVDGPERAILFEYREPCSHPGTGWNPRRWWKTRR